MGQAQLRASHVPLLKPLDKAAGSGEKGEGGTGVSAKRRMHQV